MEYLRTSRFATAALALVSLASSGSACPTYDDYVAVFGPPQHERDYGNSSSLDKRFWAINSVSNHKWDNGNLLYCIDPAAPSQNAITTAIADGFKRWIDAGADGNFIQVNAATDCSDGNRANVLWITENTNGVLASSIGKRPAAGNVLGPYMRVDVTSNDAGTGDVAANIAHELGHAFGLVHEQQRPDLWQNSDYPDGDSSNGNAFTFNCQNLADYPDLVRSLPNVVDQRRACRSIAGASRSITPSNGGQALDFSAINFLPWTGTFFDTYAGPGGDIDLKSIMMYGSFQGASRPASGPRPAVYTLANGDEISFNLIPSRKDVNGLNALYNANAKKYGKILYFLKQSSVFKKFSDFTSSSCS